MCFTESYPSTAPYIIVKNARLDPSDLAELSNELNVRAKCLAADSSIMKEIADHAYTWCSEKECDIVEEISPKPKPQRKSKPKRERTKDAESTTSKKLPPMKTAGDVISRIMWDEGIPTDCFHVGYEDRFIGIVERQFTDFSWEDLASVDYDTLAIPHHRIQYFKYKTLIVWEKSKRLDNVFGSTGSGEKITDVIERYEKEHADDTDGYYQDVDSSEEEDDDDADVVINVGDSEEVAPTVSLFSGSKHSQ